MTTRVTGHWYDGRSSRAVDATLTLKNADTLVVESNGIAAEAEFADVAISGRLGSAPRRLEFPGGAAFETAENDAIDRIITAVRPAARPWLHRFETNRRFIAVAIVVTLGIGWATFRYGIPGAADVIARFVPPSVLTTIGEQTFAAINRYGLQQSRLPASRTASIDSAFARVVDASALGTIGCRIEYRAAPKTFGPNAFAIPPCLIVVTDELVMLAEHDDEIIAVLAHEIGHIKRRHTTRRIVQDTFLTFILMLMTGDTTQVSGAIATLPALFLELGYARSFEREADQFALEFMTDHDIGSHHFPAILKRMESWRPSDDCDNPPCAGKTTRTRSDSVLDYLSTHPSTTQRARMFGGSAQVNDATIKDE